MHIDFVNMVCHLYHWVQINTDLILTSGPIFLIQVGRLPFLPSSNLQMEVLSGRYLDIGFEDILNPRDLSEVGVQPHAVMERSFGLL